MHSPFFHVNSLSSPFSQSTRHSAFKELSSLSLSKQSLSSYPWNWSINEHNTNIYCLGVKKILPFRLFVFSHTLSWPRSPTPCKRLLTALWFPSELLTLVLISCGKSHTCVLKVRKVQRKSHEEFPVHWSDWTGESSSMMLGKTMAKTFHMLLCV